MCGLAGYNLSEKEDRVDVVKLARAMLTELQARGRDAAGAAWTEGGQVWWDKAPGLPSLYAKRCPIGPLATNAVLHSRAATDGDPRDNRNNHPFALPGVTGAHNGILLDWKHWFRDLGVEPESDCDSEAIFALLAYGTGRRVDRLAPLKGDAAIAWIETDRPNTLWLVRLVGRPMAVAQTLRGSFLYASTRDILIRSAKAAEVKLAVVWEMPEDMMFRVESGRIAERVPVPAERPKWRYTQSYVGRGSIPAPPTGALTETSKALAGTWSGGKPQALPQNRKAPKPQPPAPTAFDDDDEAIEAMLRAWRTLEDFAMDVGFLENLSDAEFDEWVDMDVPDAREAVLTWCEAQYGFAPPVPR